MTQVGSSGSYLLPVLADVDVPFLVGVGLIAVCYQRLVYRVVGLGGTRGLE